MLYYCCWSIIYIYIFGCIFVLRNKSLCFLSDVPTHWKRIYDKRNAKGSKFVPFTRLYSDIYYRPYTIYILIFLFLILMNDFNLIMYINFDILDVCLLSTSYLLPQYLWMMILDTFTMWDKKFHVESLMVYWLI